MITVENIRACMIKYPRCMLWNKNLSKWGDSDKKRFGNMLKDDPEKRSPRKKLVSRSIGRKGIRILRVSDGKEYDTMTACRIDNKLHCGLMLSKLKEEIEFKRI